MTNSTFKTCCPHCDTEVNADIDMRTEAHWVRGEEIVLENVPVLVCPLCGQDIGNTLVDGPTIERAYNVYRERHSLLSTEEIKQIRARYGLSQEEFSRFLGLDSQCYTSLENGGLQTEAEDRMIRIASTPAGAQILIPLAKNFISKESLARAYSFANPTRKTPETDCKR